MTSLQGSGTGVDGRLAGGTVFAGAVGVTGAVGAGGVGVGGVGVDVCAGVGVVSGAWFSSSSGFSVSCFSGGVGGRCWISWNLMTTSRVRELDVNGNASHPLVSYSNTDTIT